MGSSAARAGPTASAIAADANNILRMRVLLSDGNTRHEDENVGMAPIISTARTDCECLQALRRRCTHKIALADLEAEAAQDVVGRRVVEKEVRQREPDEELLAFERYFARAEFEHDVLGLGAVDLFRLRGLDEIDRLGNALLEPGNGRL